MYIMLDNLTLWDKIKFVADFFLLQRLNLIKIITILIIQNLGCCLMVQNWTLEAFSYLFLVIGEVNADDHCYKLLKLFLLLF